MPLTFAYSSRPDASPSASAALHASITGEPVWVALGSIQVNVGRSSIGPPPFGAPPRIQLAILSRSAADSCGLDAGGMFPSTIVRWYTAPFISNTPGSVLVGGAGSEASY